jgi:uncharacterized radical SAM superfamily Fe-S cluster-containing enzyme
MAGLAPRPYLIEEYTRTACPECHAGGDRNPDNLLDAMLVSHDEAIWMRRFCPLHGESESLYEEDAAIWRTRTGWSTPTSQITPDHRGAGYRDGLPASHGQHTCILLVNLTEHCNYRCPTCYATALDPGTPLEEPIRPTLEELKHTAEDMIAKENGKLGVIMLSGGEPTLRRDLIQIVEMLAALPITRIMLNTNGRRIARDDRFLAELKRFNKKLEVYLQFDGLKSSTHEQLRGEDLTEEKQTIIARLQEAKIFFTMVVTVKKGVNEDELGDILRLGLDTPRCSGIAFQPVFGSGRGSDIDPQSRVTPTGVIRRLAEQASDVVKVADFIPLPCSHKDCCDITYMIRTGKEEKWRSLIELVGRDELKRWIHLVANTIAFDNVGEVVREVVKDGVLQRIFSEQQAPSSLTLAKDLFAMCGCIPGLPELVGAVWKRTSIQDTALERLAERTFRVTVKQFMDVHTFHEARLRQCCVHVGTFEEDPRRYSFCWRWMFEEASDFPATRRSDLRVLA